MTKPLRKIHVITKTTWHCLLGLSEYIGVPLLLAYLSTYLAPIVGENCCWQWIERAAFCFTLYEVILVGIRKMQTDTRKDALLALKTAYEIAELFCETDTRAIYDGLKVKINQALDNSVLNQLDVIDSCKNLMKYMDEKNTTAIKCGIINIQHAIETDNLLWNYTLFLRLFKK
ncbi:MAG TPA: hypothetical protein GX505_05795 [Clostridiales bacterium]|nr:hypothetical protein [Clostridiales bacterium]